MRRHTWSVRKKQVRRQKSTIHFSEREEVGQVLSQHMAQFVWYGAAGVVISLSWALFVNKCLQGLCCWGLILRALEVMGHLLE